MNFCQSALRLLFSFQEENPGSVTNMRRNIEDDVKLAVNVTAGILKGYATSAPEELVKAEAPFLQSFHMVLFFLIIFIFFFPALWKD